MEELLKPETYTEIVGVICLDAILGVDKDISCAYDLALIRKDISLGAGLLLERSRDIGTVILLDEPAVGFLEIRRFDQFIWVSAVIPCLEKCRRQRMGYRMPYESELAIFHNYLICNGLR